MTHQHLVAADDESYEAEELMTALNRMMIDAEYVQTNLYRAGIEKEDGESNA